MAKASFLLVKWSVSTRIHRLSLSVSGRDPTRSAATCCQVHLALSITRSFVPIVFSGLTHFTTLDGLSDLCSHAGRANARLVGFDSEYNLHQNGLTYVSARLLFVHWLVHIVHHLILLCGTSLISIIPLTLILRESHDLFNFLRSAPPLLIGDSVSSHRSWMARCIMATDDFHWPVPDLIQRTVGYFYPRL